MEMLFSVAIIILLYFVIMQTFFETKSTIEGSKIKAEVQDKLFLNQIEEIDEL
jgi:hypothetical protein